jgi:multidrug efflux pump subunit AcrB
MVTVIALIIGILFAVYCVRRTFFPSWAIVFNIMLSIYVAVMVMPVFSHLIFQKFEASEVRYHIAIAMVMFAGILFALTHIITKTFITGLYQINFNKIFDFIASALAGVLTGFIVTSFIFLAICITPISAMPFMQGYNIRSETTPKELKPVIRSCNFISWASLQVYPDKPETVIKALTMPEY